GVSINHEWRDYGPSPYAVGPSFWINGNNLQVAGKTLTTVPTGQWVRFEITAALGKKNSGLWDLTVTLPGETARTFTNLKNGNPAFEKLTWLGFVSNATDKTVFYLDNLDVTNQP
ncbi:MAG: right-handed parallel beta-helix repeat-containing protein, partial [Phycisphaerales bacterium]